MTTNQRNLARREYADSNPQSRKYFEQANKFLPGGHTRTVLTYSPFPLVFVKGVGATLTDIDGHSYLDFLGDYTAGLLGHSEDRVLKGVADALRVNASVGGIHPAEMRLAELMCQRFSLDRVRFTNSGTEANLMAITAARMKSGRERIMAFVGGYHGGILYFANGLARSNAPYDFVLAPYNNIEETIKLLEKHGDELAAVILEPMLGSGGCIPATREFATEVFGKARKVGAVVIADEVMTSRHGSSGLFNILGVEPDLITFGKYIGGGFSFGAFGGKVELMGLFDTSQPTPGRTILPHAGTFNNNLATMTAGCVVLGEIFTSEVAVAHTKRGEDFRESIAAVLQRNGSNVSVTGYGSMMTLHAVDSTQLETIFFGLLKRGIYIAPRGMVNLSLVHTDDHLSLFLSALDETTGELDQL